MVKYKELVAEFKNLKNSKGSLLGGVDPEHAARMKLQNRFSTGVDIAKYTSDIMHADMVKLHSIFGLLARLFCSTNGYGCEKIPENNFQKLCLPKWLDGSWLKIRVWTSS